MGNQATQPTTKNNVNKIKRSDSRAESIARKWLLEGLKGVYRRFMTAEFEIRKTKLEMRNKNQKFKSQEKHLLLPIKRILRIIQEISPLRSCLPAGRQNENKRCRKHSIEH